MPLQAVPDDAGQDASESFCLVEDVPADPPREDEAGKDVLDTPSLTGDDDLAQPTTATAEACPYTCNSRAYIDCCYRGRT